MSPLPSGGFDRRLFLGAGGTTLLCSLAGRTVEIRDPEDVRRADALAAGTARPRSARAPVDEATFRTPEPQPGGQAREYWLAARTVTWNVAPNRRDQWMKETFTGRRTFRAYVYQLYSTGFAEPLGPARMPGPTLFGEVGDTIVVHFRNADEALEQAVTVHPHGVRYNPEYDGAYLGDFTRAGGFIAPGEEFTYTWECTPDSVGVWPYHDHGPNHTLNTLRGLFGAVVVRRRGEPPPDIETVLYFHSFPQQVTGIPRTIQCVNGRTGAGNTPTVRARVGQDVAFHALGGDGEFHTFHVHGHRWKDASGTPVDNPGFGPNESVTARWREDNPGRWLYHCHVFAHQNAGMAGWYLVDA